MRHVRMLGLCLVAIFAVAAVMAASASAGGPEWGQCYEKAGGKYADSNCQTKAKKGTGTYEWRKASQVTTSRKFSGYGGAGILNNVIRVCESGHGHAERTKACEEKGVTEEVPLYVECASENAVGEAVGKSQVGHIAVTFKGCTLEGYSPCSNTTQEGEIDTTILKGELGYINKSKKEVGIDLTPEKKDGDFAQFTCLEGNEGIVVGGDLKPAKGESSPVYPGKKGGGDGIISPITPINQMTSELTQVYTTNEADENIPNKFEGKPLQVLEDFLYAAHEPIQSDLWSKAGEAITNVNITCDPEYPPSDNGGKLECFNEKGFGNHRLYNEIKA